MGQKASTQIFGSVLYFFCIRRSGECSDPISTDTALDGRRNKPMKEKVAVSVVVILVLASFCPAEAQQTTKAMPRIGFISSTGAPESPSPLFDAFRQGLRDLGYVDGKNILIVRRYAEGRLDRMPALVNELVQQKVDVIVAS